MTLHCKKGYRFPVPSRDVTNQTPPGRELWNCFRPGKVWLATSQLGAGKTITFFTLHIVETVFAWLAAEFGIVSTKLLTHGRTINLTRKFAYGKILILS